MYTFTENLVDLRSAESIRGIPINMADIAFLENYCRENNILKVHCSSCHELSKSKVFFINNQSRFTFLKNGVETRFCELEANNQEFIAFETKKRQLFVYAYFHYECD